MSRGPDAHTLLLRAIEQHAAAAGVPLTFAESTCNRWASATFAGHRHQIHYKSDGSFQTLQWASSLPDAEFALRGHLVADLQFIGIGTRDGESRFEIEVLTVEER